MSGDLDAEYLQSIENLSEFYVSRMPAEEYQMVGRLLDFPGSEKSVGVFRVDFKGWNVYSHDVIGSIPDMEREFAAEKFCNRVLGNAHGYSCGFFSTKPLQNSEDKILEEIR